MVTGDQLASQGCRGFGRFGHCHLGNDQLVIQMVPFWREIKRNHWMEGFGPSQTIVEG